ncbi:DUF4012 domain-containing protein [Cellulomonas dongxiuzhuiae]|uniref:DUF4012 domain-containing protein n=1 Tax=Cellulomonas dongxiuzhuiae TaxID=2819979 RepID=A0ABX8GM82_9CELL|nr:DUF4012 domain-containing protein [Cellulomonas dongxiuzhuiae]MBO3096374.1 DUF4012 domain-containing protein [Cellulomonas dongxiuzhuiae]QWC16786.1 DUF4012 domain-containing protein [Cellulomonas dongxiuzhuiae]
MGVTGTTSGGDGGAQAAPAAADPGPPAPDPSAPGGRRLVARAAVLVLVLVLLAAGWVAFRAWQAAAALQDARALLGEVTFDASSVGSVTEGLPRLRAATGRAAAASSDPVWHAAEALPWAGDQLEAVRVVSTSLHDVVTDAMPAATDLRALVDGGLRLPDGRFDVDALRDAAAQVEAAATTASRASTDVAALDPDVLVRPLAGPVRQVQDALARIDASLGPAGDVAGVLPGMLGADGPRTYLVLALNTAELRAAGGIVGTVVVVRADDGAVSVVDRRSTMDLRGLREPLPLTSEELATWDVRMGRWIQNSTLTPEFPRTAELVAARWSQSVGGTVDGVVATDPVAVAGLVGATGAVADPAGGVLDADGLVDALLRDSYQRYTDPAVADAYFGEVAERLVAAVGAGAGDSQELLLAGRRAVDERRVRVWSAHPEEQQRLGATVVGGAFTSTDLYADQPGLFLDDTTEAKLGAYLATSVTFRDATCTGPAPSVDVVLGLDFRPPLDVETFGAYVTGDPRPDVPLGTLLTTVSMWSARGAPPLVATRDGKPATGLVTSVSGRTVQQIGSRLAPGQTQELVVTVPLHDGAVTLWSTPTLTSPGAATFTCDGVLHPPG